MVPVAAKAGALLAVAAAGSTSIWYFSDSIFGTSAVSVAGDKESSYTEGSVGKKYGDYFLSSKKNQKIWEERYKENKNKFKGQNNDSTKAKDKFGTVEKAYSNEPNDTTALNKVCEAAYKETTDTNLVDTEPSDNGTTQFFNPYVWKFCGLRSISTVGSNDTYNGKIGGDATNQKLFVSTEGDGNDWFWDLKTKEFWKDQTTLAGNSQSTNEFKKFKDDTRNRNKNIKDTCDLAYKAGTDDNTNKNKEDALTFCSIKLAVGTSVGG